MHFALLSALTLTAAAAPGRLLDAPFAGELCAAWNTTKLPALLGRSGSGWIDSAGSSGTQLMVISRRDCSGWSKVQLKIVADAKGDAMCEAGGAFTGGAFQWKFEPTTKQWADFTDGFGVMQMPGIMKGFVGPYNVAASNIDNFEIFFAAAGKLALDEDVDWTCEGANASAVSKEIADIDKGDMKDILN
jgi:hypothetical protein